MSEIVPEGQIMQQLQDYAKELGVDLDKLIADAARDVPIDLPAPQGEAVELRRWPKTEPLPDVCCVCGAYNGYLDNPDDCRACGGFQDYSYG